MRRHLVLCKKHTFGEDAWFFTHKIDLLIKFSLKIMSKELQITQNMKRSTNRIEIPSSEASHVLYDDNYLSKLVLELVLYLIFLTIITTRNISPSFFHFYIIFSFFSCFKLFR